MTFQIQLAVITVDAPSLVKCLQNLFVCSFCFFLSFVCLFKGGPEPFEKEIHDILGSKREHRFSNPFFELVQKRCQVHFSYLLRLGNFCKGPRTLRKFPQNC